MNPAVTEILKSTKARVLYVVFALMAVFKFIGDFKVPGDRLGYLGSALAYVWPDVLVLLVLVLVVAFHAWWLPATRRGIADWWRRLRGNRWILASTLVLLVAAGVALSPRATTAYHQTLSAVDARLQVYRYAFGFRYADALRARAVEQLHAGNPESAGKLLDRAQKWTFGSPTLSENIKELRALAQARVELSAALAKGLTRAQRHNLAYVGTAALDAAYVLNTEGDGLRALLSERSVQARRFGRFLEPALASCGNAPAPVAEANGYRDACTQLASEQFNDKAVGCPALARLYCQRMPVPSDEGRRRLAARNFIAGALGIGEMLAVLDEDKPAARP